MESNNIFKKIWHKIVAYLSPFFNWRFLVSYIIPYMIVDGWCYIFILLGSLFHIYWMRNVGAVWLSFLWMPWTCEKLIIVPCAIWIHKRLFKNDPKTKMQLERMKQEASNDFQKVKNFFSKRKVEEETKL